MADNEGRFQILQAPQQAPQQAPRFEIIQRAPQAASVQRDEPEYEGFFQEIAEGVGSGVIGIGQGLLELGAGAVDLVADTNYASKVTDGANYLRNVTGLDPAGFLGKTAEVMTQFVVPGLAAASAVSKAAQAGRLARGIYAGQQVSNAERLALGAKQLAAAGLVDAAVASDGMTTIGDFFDGGPTQTDQRVGLSGREEALRRLTNKLKIGAESVGVGGAVVGALSGAGAAARSQAGQAVGRALAPVARGAELPARPVVNVAGAGLKAAADITAGPTSAAIRGAAQTAPGRAVTQQAGNLRQYLRDLEEARVFGATPGGPTGRTGIGGSVLNAGENILGNTMEMLRYRSALPEEVARERLLGVTRAQSPTKQAQVYMRRFDQQLDRVMNTVDDLTQEATPLHRAEVYNMMQEYLTAPTPDTMTNVLKRMPRQTHEPLKQMRGLLDNMRQSVLDSETLKRNNFINPDTGRDLQTVIEENLSSYMRRRYRIFEDPNYAPSKEALDLGLQGFMRNPKAINEELTRLARQDLIKKPDAPQVITDELLGRLGAQRVGAGDQMRIEIARPTEAAARFARDSFVQRNQLKKRGLFGYKNLNAGRIAENQINTNMFVERTNIPKFQRALLGEIDDPQEQFIATIADLAEYRATDAYFANVARMADNNQGIGRFFINPDRLTPQQLDDMLKSEQYVQLGGRGGASRLGETPAGAMERPEVSAWGPLYGYVVPERVYRDLTQKVIGGSDNELVNGLRATYSAFLRGKGASQYGATVLSPITQLRNVSTASAFAAAQGNIGREASLGDSVRLVLQDIKDLPTDAALKELEEMQNLGILGSNTELRELQDLIGQGLGYAGERPGQYGSNAFASRLQDSRLGGFLGSVNRKAQDLYQGGDDIWKIYNYRFEQEKLRNALRNAPVEDQVRQLTRGREMDVTPDQLMRQVQNDPEVLNRLVNERAAQVVRDTVPNYNMAPEAVRLLRRTPFGNFTAFPYEIMRTGVNTIRYGLDDLLSDNREVQKIGMRRLMGAGTTFGLMPVAASKLGEELSGVSEEEMEAYRRSFGAPWEKNARLIPIGRDEKGLPVYVNFSYSNPYDMLDRILNTAMNQVDEGRRLGRSSDQILLGAINETFKETFRPFYEESILTGRIRDVANPNAENSLAQIVGTVVGGRGGRTQTGGYVYRPGESTGDIAAKSFFHVLDAFIPGGVPVNVRGGELEPSRILRGTVGNVAPELVNPMDRQGRVYDAGTELFRAVTGVTPMTINAERAIYFRGSEFQREMRDATALFNSVASRANVTPDDLASAYQAANQARYRAANSFYQAVEDMRAMGLDRRQIERYLREGNIGDVGWVLRGRFEPFDPSNDIISRMRRNGTAQLMPRDRIRSIAQEYRGMQLVTDPETEERNTAPRPSAPAPAPTGGASQPRFEILRPAPGQQGAVRPNLAPTAAPVDTAALLGGNPATQEIARRLQGQ